MIYARGLLRSLFLLLILFYLIVGSTTGQPNTFFKVYYSTPTLGAASSVIEADNGNYIITMPGRSTPLINEKLFLTDSIGDTILTKTYCSGGATSIFKAADGNYLYITTTTPPCINVTTMADFKVV
ncbi:MAG: hypothetical protein JNL47_05490 [Bacteroidia bacterium]|nr:hypothetical protein [Bacteroidia bacterium]